MGYTGGNKKTEQELHESVVADTTHDFRQSTYVHGTDFAFREAEVKICKDHVEDAFLHDSPGHLGPDVLLRYEHPCRRAATHARFARSERELFPVYAGKRC